MLLSGPSVRWLIRLDKSWHFWIYLTYLPVELNDPVSQPYFPLNRDTANYEYSINEPWKVSSAIIFIDLFAIQIRKEYFKEA